ncbi:hypothetical protein FRB91_004832 [Serendipita sp. 411]|nr:hypothetical protein FRC18_004792 [Serendipita sp. 400]KAG8860049.1 hypothetical protein FRB91_004832 [Serendipita sp. 411]
MSVGVSLYTSWELLKALPGQYPSSIRTSIIFPTLAEILERSGPYGGIRSFELSWTGDRTWRLLRQQQLDRYLIWTIREASRTYCGAITGGRRCYLSFPGDREVDYGVRYTGLSISSFLRKRVALTCFVANEHIGEWNVPYSDKGSNTTMGHRTSFEVGRRNGQDPIW